MPTPDTIHQLVARFRANLDSYKRGQYNETQVRREFIDPFFETLGWDVSNRQGYAEAYKDVVHEDAIKVGGGVKAPDYGFRIGGVRKFFVEAKKPSVDVRGDPHPAYQLRRYAWSAKLALSILTDFEEFAVYDCRVRPDKGDKSATARVLYLTFDQYDARWDEIAGIFSREAILKGVFDRFAEAKGGKRGTAEVDAAFLTEIEGWRDGLARGIALRNPGLSQRELNFAVQRTIDRIIFLRICEDRGVEPYGSLLALVNGGEIYQRLLLHFRHADARYNSGLFYFQSQSQSQSQSQTEKGRGDAPDTLTPLLTIDDKLLREILKSLYYPDSPYEFSVLPADLLGQVYEQFLGKVIRLTPGHRAVVEEKPEVRKAGGVFYTPTFIVDAIVKQTVGKLLAGLTLRQVAGLAPRLGRKAAPLRIADIACGSGSFLLGAYQFLLDWYLAAYLAEGAEKWATGRTPRLYQTARDEWRLTITERKRILLEHIYGVDIDPQAVEVTKLSLLLKVLEGEDEQTLGQQLALFPERALPDLGRNIQCGNSLIGPDFYDGQQLALLDDEAALRVNVFDWQAEFPQVFADGGFDAIVGNPPWGASYLAIEESYLRVKYVTGQGRTLDSYALFIERASQILRDEGMLGYIVPDTFLRKDGYLPTRKVFFERHKIHVLIETGPVFSKVRDTWCLVFSLSKSTPDAHNRISHRKLSRYIVSAEERLAQFGKGEWNADTEIPQQVWMHRPGMVVGYLATAEAQEIIARRFENQPRLRDLDSDFLVSRGEEGSKFNLVEQKDGDCWMVIPKDVLRFEVAPGIRITSGSLTPSKRQEFYSRPKIWVIRIQKMRWKQRLVCGLDERNDSAGMKTLQVIVSRQDDVGRLKYLQGILASKLMNFWCVNYLADDMNKSYLEQLPIRTVDFTNPADAARHDRMVSLVQRMLDLHKKLAAEGAPHVKTVLQRQIEATDRQIDALVYELYGLTAAEIAVVEGAA